MSSLTKSLVLTRVLTNMRALVISSTSKSRVRTPSLSFSLTRQYRWSIESTVRCLLLMVTDCGERIYLLAMLLIFGGIVAEKRAV